MDITTWLSHRWWLPTLVLIVCAGIVAVNLGDPAPIALGIAAAISVVGVDRWLPMVLANGLLVGGYFAVGGDNSYILATTVAAAFLAGLRSPVRHWLPYVVLGGVAAWAGLLVQGLRLDEVSVDGWQTFGIGTGVAAASAISTSIRVRGSALRDRRDRAAADEKLRMAQQLHDGVGHGLAVIAMQAGAALHVLDRDPARVRTHLEAIRTTSRESLDALRAELAAISGAGGSADASAPRRPTAGLADLPALVERVRATGLEVELVGSPGSLPDPLGDVLYGVAQESLTNVLRHARASRVRVAFESSPEIVRLTVSDDGDGVVGPVQPGMGIAGMRARVEGVGGRLSAGTADGGGYRVSAELPLRSSQAQ